VSNKADPMNIGELSASYATGGPVCSGGAKSESVRKGTRNPDGGGLLLNWVGENWGLVVLFI